MGIDGIGKPSGIEPGLGVDVASSIGSTRAERASVGAPTEGSPAQGSEALGRLERGELSIDQYLDIQVERATSHMVQHVSPEELGFVKAALRQQLQSDPVLLQLVPHTIRGSSNE